MRWKAAGVGECLLSKMVRRITQSEVPKHVAEMLGDQGELQVSIGDAVGVYRHLLKFHKGLSVGPRTLAANSRGVLSEHSLHCLGKLSERLLKVHLSCRLEHCERVRVHAREGQARCVLIGLVGRSDLFRHLVILIRDLSKVSTNWKLDSERSSESTVEGGASTSMASGREATLTTSALATSEVASKEDEAIAEGKNTERKCETRFKSLEIWWFKLELKWPSHFGNMIPTTHCLLSASSTQVQNISDNNKQYDAFVSANGAAWAATFLGQKKPAVRGCCYLPQSVCSTDTTLVHSQKASC